MPEEGINYVDRKDLLTFEEMERLISVLAELGISKVRITGGEPFIRKGIMGFIEQISRIDGIDQLHITTNGTHISGLAERLKALKVKSINLSLDSIDPERFFKITRRDVFEQVWKSMYELIDSGIRVKLNAVVMKEHNLQDIVPMVQLTKQLPIDVRFIEEMPFNGSGNRHQRLEWDHHAILNHIAEAFPSIQKSEDPAFATASHFQVPGHLGKIGIIAAYSRSFCGTCNRIRLTPKGMLKTCLYDEGVFNIRNIMRAGASNDQLKDTFLQALSNRAKDGFEAENKRKGDQASESMATIGG